MSPRRRVLLAMGLMFTAVVLPRPARADCCWPSGGGEVLVAALLLPSALGSDSDVRVLVGWPVQIPLDEKSSARLVVTPRLAFRTDRPLTTFDLRAGIRWAPPRASRERRLSFVMGAGALAEGSPVVRPLASAELGVRWGRPSGWGDLGALYLLAQGDFGVPTRQDGGTPPARLGLSFSLGFL
jgi:hypothetical protein